MNKKIFKTVTDENVSLVDNTTGEVLGFKHRKVCVTQEEFIKIYLNQIDELTGCLEDGLYAVMFAVWKCSEFPQDDSEGNIFYNSPYFKKTCRKLGVTMSDNAINMSLTRLSKRGVLKRLSRGVYMLNPKWFVKGNITERTRMEIIVEFSGDGSCQEKDLGNEKDE